MSSSIARTAPALTSAAASPGGDVCGGHSTVDEQVLVLQYREDRLAGRGHAVMPGTDVRCPIGIGDDRRKSRLQRDSNASAGREPDVGVGELKAAVECRHHEVNLPRCDLVTVAPANHATVVRASVQCEVREALIEAHQ